MPAQLIDLGEMVESEKADRLLAVRTEMDSLIAWLTGPSLNTPLHRVEAELLPKLMNLGVLLLSVWFAHRVPTQVPRTVRSGRGWYLFDGIGAAPVRTRFGVSYLRRPEYLLVDGRGPTKLAPYDRQVGLAAGRMSLGIHLLVAALVARMPFQGSVDVMKLFGGYTPSTRSMHGIVDKLGPVAATHMEQLPPPDDDGSILVIEVDHKGIPHIGPEEHRQRRKKQSRRPRGLSKRQRSHNRRSRKRRERKKKGDKSKNARMAAVGVIYTLEPTPDGGVSRPLNRRVFGTFKGTRAMFEMLKKEAIKRGYGEKQTIFLADGELQLWTLHKEFFPKAIGCLDWYHLSEYLWKAASSAAGSATKAGQAKRKLWVKARQEELRDDRPDLVVAALRELRATIGKSGPGTKNRRKNVDSAITYIKNHVDYMPYRDLLAQDLIIGTGNIEGVAKFVGSRLDGSGMRWSKERAEHVLALRCVLASNEWSGFEEAAARDHESLQDWHIERVTPARAMTPHSAIRKAA